MNHMHVRSCGMSGVGVLDGFIPSLVEAGLCVGSAIGSAMVVVVKQARSQMDPGSILPGRAFSWGVFCVALGELRGCGFSSPFPMFTKTTKLGDV